MEKLYTVCLPVTDGNTEKKIKQFIDCVYAENETDACKKVAQEHRIFYPDGLVAEQAEKCAVPHIGEAGICEMLGLEYETDVYGFDWIRCPSPYKKLSSGSSASSSASKSKS